MPSDGQQLHQPRREREDAAPEAADQSRQHAVAAALAQVEPGVVELDDAGDEAVDAHGHQQRDADQHGDPHAERGGRHGAERDDDDLRGEDEVGAHGALDLVALDGAQVDRRDRRVPRAVPCVLVLLLAMRQRVPDLLEALVAEEQAADHQQRHDRPGRDRADQRAPRARGSPC